MHTEDDNLNNNPVTIAEFYLHACLVVTTKESAVDSDYCPRQLQIYTIKTHAARITIAAPEWPYFTCRTRHHVTTGRNLELRMPYGNGERARDEGMDQSPTIALGSREKDAEIDVLKLEIHGSRWVIYCTIFVLQMLHSPSRNLQAEMTSKSQGTLLVPATWTLDMA
jgi:hypothetical protein